MVTDKEFNALRARMMHLEDIPEAKPGRPIKESLLPLLHQILDRLEALERHAHEHPPEEEIKR